MWLTTVKIHKKAGRQLRILELSKANLAMLARIGALNNISSSVKMHRRDALWQVEKAGHRVVRSSSRKGPPARP